MSFATYRITRRIAIAALTFTLASGGAIAHGHKAKKKMMNTAQPNIVEVAASTGQFETLIAAAKAAGLAGALSGPGPLTVFAPTDEAFEKLPEGTVETLLQPENKEQLVAILTYHVAPAKLKAADVVGRDSIATLNGKQPRITVNGSQVKIDGANIVKVDVAASNGIIHVIDAVLLPPESNPQSSAMDTQAVIELAISKGAPLYNQGQAGACADLYEVTAASLLTMDTGLNRQQRQMLETAMGDASHSHSDRRRAWIMRDALDAVYDAERDMSVAAK